ncbi:hypothetical protein J6590_038486 [Homalodisca vitripennis]|nr:hypothetical protein J6590_038486 [Homalodisca vitripennis]
MSVVSRTHIVHIVICSLVIGTTRNCSAQRRCQLSVGLTSSTSRSVHCADVSRTHIVHIVICSLVIGTTRNCSAQRRCQLSVGLTTSTS